MQKVGPVYGETPRGWSTVGSGGGATELGDRYADRRTIIEKLGRFETKELEIGPVGPHGGDKRDPSMCVEPPLELVQLRSLIPRYRLGQGSGCIDRFSITAPIKRMGRVI